MVVAILIPVKAFAERAEAFFNALIRLEYPKESLHIIFLDDFADTASKRALEYFQTDERIKTYASIEVIPGIDFWGDNTTSRDAALFGDKIAFYGHLSRIRQRLLDRARELKVDAALCIDSDVLIAPQLLNHLIAQQKDIVGSIIPVTESNDNGIQEFIYSRPINAMNLNNNSDNDYHHWTHYSPNCCTLVHMTGAVYLLSKQILNSSVSYPELAHYQGEDLGFCAALRKAGFTIWLDSTPLCIHIMSLSRLPKAIADYQMAWSKESINEFTEKISTSVFVSNKSIPATFVYPPTIPWGTMFQRPQQIMKALAKQGARSIFVDASHNVHSPFEEVEDNLFVINDISQATQLISRPLIGWVSYPPTYSSFTVLSPDTMIFDALDMPEGEFAGWKHGYAAAQNNASIIFCSSQALYDYNKATHNNKCVLLLNGADYKHFSTRTTLANDMPKTGRKVLGFVGALASWLDWALLEELPSLLPEYEIVYVGSWFGSIHGTNNPQVHFLGHRPYSDLPKYISGFDVSMVPFKITSMTNGVNPIKLWEYLAVGVPVVSTPLPEAIALNKVVSIASSPQEFADAIRSSSSHCTPGQRRRVAKNNSWDTRAITVFDTLYNSGIIKKST